MGKKINLDFLKPKESRTKPFTELTDELRTQIEKEAVDRFVSNINLSSLFQQTEEESIFNKILPWVTIILIIIGFFF